MRILLVYYDYYFDCVLSSLLIYVDRLFDFMSISKYGSGTGWAVGLTFKLEPTWICVWLEYSRRSSIDDDIVWYFKRSLLVSRPPGSGWTRRLTRSACWLMTTERRVVRWQTNVQHEYAERIWMSSALVATKVRPLERAGQFGQVRDWRDVFTHRKNRTVGER